MFPFLSIKTLKVLFLLFWTIFTFHMTTALVYLYTWFKYLAKYITYLSDITVSFIIYLCIFGTQNNNRRIKDRIAHAICYSLHHNLLCAQFSKKSESRKVSVTNQIFMSISHLTKYRKRISLIFNDVDGMASGYWLGRYSM